MRLRPGLPVLWRGTTQVQVGTDPRWAVALTGLSPSAARALPGLPWDESRALRAQLAREQVAVEEVEAVVDHLRAAGLLTPAPPDAGPASPDHTAWSLLSDDADGSRVLAARSRRVVRVCGLGRLGLSIATCVAAAGTGTVELDDPGPVRRADIGVGGLTPRDVGAPRAATAARLLHDLAPAVRTAAPGRRHPDLVVLVEALVADPERHLRLLADDVPHLSVVVREASVLVGPLVQPGHGPCLRCLELHRADRDPAWPAVAAQLARRAPQALGGEETTLVRVAAGIAAAQVMAHLDGRPTAVHGAGLEIPLPDVLPRRLSWRPHPDCGCAGLVGVPAGRPAGTASR